MEDTSDWRLGYSEKALSKIELAIAAYKKGKYTLSDACKKYGIPEEHFKLCLEEIDIQEASTEIIKQGNVTHQGSLQQEHIFEEGKLLDLQNLLRQGNSLETGNLEGEESVIEEIVVEEEIIIEDVIEEGEIKTESNESLISKESSKATKVVPAKWTQEEMHLALNFYTQRRCTFNEVCANFGISKKEFKEQLLAYEALKLNDQISEPCHIFTDVGIEEEQEKQFLPQEIESKNEPQHLLTHIREQKVLTQVSTKDVEQIMPKKGRSKRQKVLAQAPTKDAEQIIPKKRRSKRQEVLGQVPKENVEQIIPKKKGSKLQEVLAKVPTEDVGQIMYTKRNLKQTEIGTSLLLLPDTKDASVKTEAENKLATYIVNLQEGMFDPKAADIKRLAFSLFEHYNVDYKQKAGKMWLMNFLGKSQQISKPPISNSLLTKEYLFERTDEHFEALESVFTKYNIDASKIYNVEFTQLSDSITFVYCCSAEGVYISPMIILPESTEVHNLLQRPELFENWSIATSSSGKFTPELFVTWLKLFIGHAHPTFEQKVVLCLDEYSTKCKSLTSLELAHQNGIILMQVPTSGSVRMQPLMMTFERAMHFHYTLQTEEWCQRTFKFSIPLEKSLEILLHVYRKSATIENAVQGFQNVGIWPLNRILFLGVIVGLENVRGMVIEETRAELPVQADPCGTLENSANELEGCSLLSSHNDSVICEELVVCELADDETIEDKEMDSPEVEAAEMDRTDVETRGEETKEETRRLENANVNEETESEGIIRIKSNLNSTISTVIVNEDNTAEDLQQKTREEENTSEEEFIPSCVESNQVLPNSTSDIASVRFCRIHCTACDVHIGSAPSQITNMFEHPKLRTLLCLKCYEFYGDGDFEQGDDQTDMFCRWCANGGNLYCCSSCSNTFCAKCIKRNFDTVVAKKIEADENWKCFVCDATDLYPARSLCRAIIQHIQTVSKILQSDKTLTAAQIDEKMNLDEARCCIRKKKRKRRRTGSCSEDEDDETYNPILSEIPQAKRRRTRKSGTYPSAIHTNGSVNNQSDDESSLLVGDNDLLPAMLACEQTMTEGETALPFGPPPPPPPLQRAKPPLLIYTNNTKINPIPTANLLKPIQVRRLTPAGQFTQAPRPMLVQKRPNRPMVSIPQPQSQSQPQPQPKPKPKPQPQLQVQAQGQAQQKRPRVLIPQPRPQKRPDSGSGIPKIIDLDSDSDEAIEVIAEASRSPPKNKAQQNNESAVVSEMRDKTFEQIILDQKQDIDLALQTLRKKFSTILSASPNEAQRNTPSSASLKMRQFQQVMRKAMCRLAQINDRVVREYHCWKKHQSNENSERTKVDLQPSKNPEIDLEMTCVRDSASESEVEDEDRSKETIVKASNLEADQLDCYKNLTLFRKKVTLEQGVGDDSVFKEDKSVQVDVVRIRDYDKSVGYSLLMKAEYDPKTNKEVLKPVAVPNEYFGKFQEQFIYHLQHIEDNGIKTNDDVDDLPDPNETPLKDLIEANSPFIAEMLENIAPTVTNGSSSMETEMIVYDMPRDKENVPGKASEDHRADPTVATSKAVEELVKMVTKLSDELKSTNNSPENNALSSTGKTDESEETSKKGKIKTNDESKDEETVLAVRTLIEEESSSSNDFSEPPGGAQQMEEGCSFLN